MTDPEGIEHLADRLLLILDSEVIDVGLVPIAIRQEWPHLASDRLVITGPQWRHVLTVHSEMKNLARVVLLAMVDPDEIHRDKISDSSAILWRRLDAKGNYWVRVSVSLATADKGLDRANSLITAWRIRKRGYESDVRAGRRIWQKEKS